MKGTMRWGHGDDRSQNYPSYEVKLIQFRRGLVLFDDWDDDGNLYPVRMTGKEFLRSNLGDLTYEGEWIDNFPAKGWATVEGKWTRGDKWEGWFMLAGKKIRYIPTRTRRIKEAI